MARATRAAQRVAHALPALVIAASVLAACQDGGAVKPGAYRTPEVVSVRVVDASVRLPFREYELSTIDRTRMQQDEARLLQRCMADRGQAVTLGGDYLVGAKQSDLLDPLMWGGPFGTMPLEHAKRFGYKPEPGGTFVKGPGFYLSNPGHIYVETHKAGGEPATERAFYGRNSDGRNEGGASEGSSTEDGEIGCMAEVEAALGAPLVDTIDLEADLSRLAREHPRVEAAMGDWVACMNERGYRFEHVWDASQQFTLSQGSRRQVKVAVDDVECTTESGWANYYYAVLADYERQAIEKDPDLLESALEAENSRLVAIERALTREE